jgi:hypothetical protein
MTRRDHIRHALDVIYDQIFRVTKGIKWVVLGARVRRKQLFFREFMLAVAMSA